MSNLRTYDALSKLETFQDRLAYLYLGGQPGSETFGGLRQINQDFYSSNQWRTVRRHVILRDNGFDLGIPGHQIVGPVYVHHMNPISPHILVHKTELALDPEFLITVSKPTHSQIHFAKELPEPFVYVEREPGDTTLW